MTLQSELQGADAGYIPPGAPTIAEPVAFFRRLVASGRFHRDGGFGRIYHPGSVSLRENAAPNWDEQLSYAGQTDEFRRRGPSEA